MTGIKFFVVLQALAFQWSCLVAVTVAETQSEPTRQHGHHHHHRHHKAEDEADQEEAINQRAGDSEVTLTPGGAFQRGHSMMRRESERVSADEPSEERHHEQHNVKALFQAIDLNGDGKISQDEIDNVAKMFAESPDDVRKRGQHITNLVVEDTDDNDDGAIDYDEFVSSMHRRAPSRARQEHHSHSTGAHHRNHNKQQAKSAAEEIQAKPYYSKVEEHVPIEIETEEGFSQGSLSQLSDGNDPVLAVSCGGHRAPDCAQCPTYYQGDIHTSMGPDYCHHDCRWCSSGGTAGVCINNQTGVCASEGTISNDASTMPDLVKKQPDLLDPNMTARDENIVNDAAAAAIKEENLEAASRQRAEEEAAEEKKFSWSKFWLIVIITFSVILGICAIVSVVALVVFCCMGVTENAPKELADEGEEDDGEGEGEAGDGEEANEAES
jgi:hypothetical protein